MCEEGTPVAPAASWLGGNLRIKASARPAAERERGQQPVGREQSM